MKKLISLVMTLCMVTILFASCSSAPKDNASSSKASSSTTNMKLAWFAPAPHPFFTDVQKGIDKFEKDTGITVIRKIGPDWTQNNENQQVEALAAQKITDITMYPSDGSGANGLYSELTQKGIHVISFGTSTVKPTTASFAAATDVKQAAYNACEEVIKKMGGKGNIINVLEILTDPNTVLRKQGIEECVAKYPDVKIIQTVGDINSSNDAISKIQAALSASNGKVDGMVATGNTATSGMCQVLSDYYKQNSSAKKISAIGIDTDPVTMKAIQDGTIYGTIAQNSAGMAYISLMILKDMDQGYKVKSGSYFIDTGNVLVTKDNLNTYQSDIDSLTNTILSKLTTDYLTK